MFRSNHKGFTLIEILVTVLIIAILAAIGIMAYERFIERTRSADAENTIGLASYAQGRQLMRKGRYTLLWPSLDAAPLATYMDKKGDYVSEDGKIFWTKGGGADNPRNGFKMYFEDINGDFFIVAERVGGWGYSYTLVRPLKEERTYCVSSGSSADNTFCMDFMNVDTEADIPADPRVAGSSPQP